MGGEVGGGVAGGAVAAGGGVVADGDVGAGEATGDGKPDCVAAGLGTALALDTGEGCADDGCIGGG